MGGQNSKPSEEQNQIEEQIEEPIETTVEDNNDFKVDEFYNKIDDIATNYILTMDFK